MWEIDAWGGDGVETKADDERQPLSEAAEERSPRTDFLYLSRRIGTYSIISHTGQT